MDFSEGALGSSAPSGAPLVVGDPDGDHLRLFPAGAAEGPDPSDRWIAAVVEVAAGVFRARASAPVLASELRHLRDGLAALPADPRGRAALETEDGWLAIRVFGDGFGHLDARCELRDPDAVPHRLEFTIGLDLRDVPALLSGVDAILDAAYVRQPAAASGGAGQTRP